MDIYYVCIINNIYTLQKINKLINKIKYMNKYYLQHLLPENGNVIFSEEYDLDQTEVVWTYEPGKVASLKKQKIICT